MSWSGSDGWSLQNLVGEDKMFPEETHTHRLSLSLLTDRDLDDYYNITGCNR